MASKLPWLKYNWALLVLDKSSNYKERANYKSERVEGSLDSMLVGYTLGEDTGIDRKDSNSY